MPKVKKSKKLDAETAFEGWMSGRGHKFQTGDVVRRKEDMTLKAGVIRYALTAIETYSVTWFVGPKPWDSIEGETIGSRLVKVNEPNPVAYKWSERIPGPSSDEIDRLKVLFAKKDVRDKARTAKEVDFQMSLLEEELSKKKNIEEIDESKVDSIVDATLDEDLEIPIDGISVDRKIKNIIDEE